MLHLLAGVSPGSLGTWPFAPVFGHGLTMPASAVALPFHARANVYLLPSIGGYVGADTSGALLAAGFDEDGEGVRLLADIGTNCELALHKGDEVLASSTPAGPAFEGARMAFGMLAGPGAIERVRFDEDCEVRVIGGVAPQGICGSGIVDTAAELHRVGIIDETGRMRDSEELPPNLAPLLRSRLRSYDKGNAFELARNADGESILFTQRDVRELQLAKAAIRSGIDTLLDVAEIGVESVDEFLIAGGFGSYLNKENARALGIIPDVATEHIHYIGNAALVGARLALISVDMRAEAESLARRVRHVQIARTADFQMRFTEAMFF
jgi:uncharacterized 2Fe-2S/4Fe-4S cluster protein (DUF4445 family)